MKTMTRFAITILLFALPLWSGCGSLHGLQDWEIERKIADEKREQQSKAAQLEAKQRLEHFLDAAKKGDAEAQYQLGKGYLDYVSGEDFWNFPIDEKKGIKWLRKAAEQGHADAQFRLGWAYTCSSVPKNPVEGIKWFRKAAEQGHARAQCELGNLYSMSNDHFQKKYYRRIISEDLTEAARWYRKAAEQGDTGGQISLGVCYYYGRGVPEDKEEGVRWYRLAVEQGNSHAMALLGGCYYRGEGVPQNYTEAVKWYRQADEHGDPFARYELGKCYYNGEGVPQDKAEAIRLFRRGGETSWSWYGGGKELIKWYLNDDYIPEEAELDGWFATLRHLAEQDGQSEYAVNEAKEAADLLHALERKR